MTNFPARLPSNGRRDSCALIPLTRCLNRGAHSIMSLYLPQNCGHSSPLAEGRRDGGIGVIKSFFCKFLEFLDRIGTWDASKYRVDDVKDLPGNTLPRNCREACSLQFELLSRQTPILDFTPA